MSLSNLRRFDVQANWALALSIISALPFLAAATQTVLRYDGNLGQIVYGQGSKFAPALLVCLLLSMAPSFVGFVLGWSSAGQRRNEKSNRSWIGFFLGGLVFTLSFILLLAFWKLRLVVPIG